MRKNLASVSVLSFFNFLLNIISSKKCFVATVFFTRRRRLQTLKGERKSRQKNVFSLLLFRIGKKLREERRGKERERSKEWKR